MKATPAAREKLDEIQRGFETLAYELDDGDIVRLGDIEFRFELKKP